jgi:lipid-A-disaccharide synthase-like uncharacterized protein
MILVRPLFTFDLFGIALPISLLTLFGLIGNAFFTARVLVQWIASERNKRSVVPVAFWWTSLSAAVIHILYSLGRHDEHGAYDPDLPMFIGLAATLLPYIRSLRIHYRPDRPPRPAGPFIAIAAAIMLVLIAVAAAGVPFDTWWLFTLGIAGNAIYRSRFFVAWIHSERHRRAELPLAFWYLSMAGSFLLLAYSLLRGDAVFLLSFLFNSAPYLRNIVLLRRDRPA